MKILSIILLILGIAIFIGNFLKPFEAIYMFYSTIVLLFTIAIFYITKQERRTKR